MNYFVSTFISFQFLKKNLRLLKYIKNSKASFNLQCIKVNRHILQIKILLSYITVPIYFKETLTRLFYIKFSLNVKKIFGLIKLGDVLKAFL